MTYRVPLGDITSALRHVADIDRLAGGGLFPDAAPDIVDAVLGEAASFAESRIAPLNRVGDEVGARLKEGRVVLPPGWREVYQDWREAGWNGLAAPQAFGGQGLPHLLLAATTEIWHQASMAFALAPLLTAGAIEALHAHACEKLRALYLPHLVSGRWMGTMSLTESGAGSDLAEIKTQATARGDGSYRLRGEKIFVSYGEHDMADNIVHLVLARLPDAPPGTKGISLFLAPKFLPDAEGKPGARNDIVCARIERKLGLHASPTCALILGGSGGAAGFLIGEENRGLAAMFTMMNAARLGVGLQGVAIAERARQAALAYARERRQGRLPGVASQAALIDHPDVRRMLMEMASKTAAARGICYLVAEAIDMSRSEDARTARHAMDRAALLTPVAKAYATDIGIEVASLGIQVHGGAGYIEETGAAQYLRDARIAAIYEGTNGIQAVDLVTRKLGLGDGAAIGRLIAEMKRTAAHLPGLAGAVDAFERATAWMSEAAAHRPRDALAGACAYLRLFATVLGATLLTREAMAEQARGPRYDKARFFMSHIGSGAAGLAEAAMGGAASLGTHALDPPS